MRQENEREHQGEGGKTGTGIRGTDMGMAMKKAHGKILKVTEMTMLRLMCGVRPTKLDKIRNERIRGQQKWRKPQRKSRKGS